MSRREFSNLHRWGQSTVLALALLALLTSAGCTRRFFRKAADREVAEVLAQKDVVPEWKIENYAGPYPDSRARFADPTNPDRPPMPPDDPSAKMLSPNPQKPGHAGIGLQEGTGYLDMLAAWDAQNRAGAAVAADDQKKAFLITMDQAVELGVLNSREFQRAREDLYLTALPVTLQRFAFAAHFFATENAVREWSGRLAPDGKQNKWTANSNVGFSKLFSTGALLLLRFANETVVDLTGNLPRHTTSVSQLNLDLVQPLLRGGGRAVTLEPLTQAERDLVYEIRDYARFREQFYANITTGGDLNLFTVQPVRQGFLPTALRSAQLDIDRKNLNDLKNDFKRFEALKEGGDIPPLQVETVRNQVLQSQSTVLRDEQDVRDALDAFKLQLGLPINVALALDTAPLQPINDQLGRLENLFEDMQQARTVEPPAEAAKLRPTLRKVLTSARLVQDTKLQKTILARWAAWEADKLTIENVDAKLTKANAKRRELLDLKTKAEVEKKTWTDQQERQLKEQEADIDLGELERAVRKYEAQPWAKINEPLKAQRLREDLFENVSHYFELVLGEAQAERLEHARRLWPRLAPIEIAGADLVVDELDHALDVGSQTALANRFDLMNARARLVDSWRQIAVSANSLLAVFDVEYHLAGFSPPGQAKPFTVDGSRMRHQLAINTELPLVRKAERNDYRTQLIDYQRARRDLMAAEDRVSAGVRGQIRQLQVLAENYKIQQQLVELAYYLRDSSREALLQPPAPGRPLDYTALTTQYLQNQTNLVQRQNGLYALWIQYFVTRLQTYRDMELLQLDSRGVWIDEHLYRADARPGIDAPGAQP